MTVLRLLTVLPLIITVWATDPKVVVRQTFPYTKKVNNYKSIVVEKDADAYMACVVDNKPGDRKECVTDLTIISFDLSADTRESEELEPAIPVFVNTDKLLDVFTQEIFRVQWFAQNFNSKTNIPISTDTDSQNPYKYQIDKPAANNWRLKVQNSQESDIALYICRVQLGGQQSANDSRMLIVQQKPQIIDIYTSDDSTVDEGDRVQLDCGAGGIPRPKISWMMAGGGVLPTGGRVLQQPQLIITSVTLEHRGAYICIAKNAAGEDRRRIVLDVEFYPRLTASNPEVRQAVGYGRDLMCEVKGNPVPGPGDLIWYSPLGVPLADENKYIFENFTGGNFVLMKMRITKVEPGDFGQYKCFAINKEGQGESFVNLVESYSPVDERTGRSGTAILSFSMLTLAMLMITSLLHFC